LQKLTLYKSAIKWIKSLNAIEDRVKLNGFHSEWAEVLSGILLRTNFVHYLYQ